MFEGYGGWDFVLFEMGVFKSFVGNKGEFLLIFEIVFIILSGDFKR